MSTAAGSPSRRPSPRPTPRRAASPPTRKLVVVEAARGRTWRLRLLGGVAGLLLFAALLGLAVFHSVLVQGQLGLDRMDKEIEQEQVLQRGLRKQVAELASPERIQSEALARGMVLPNERTYIQAVAEGQVPPPEVDR